MKLFLITVILSMTAAEVIIEENLENSGILSEESANENSYNNDINITGASDDVSNVQNVTDFKIGESNTEISGNNSEIVDEAWNLTSVNDTLLESNETLESPNDVSMPENSTGLYTIEQVENINNLENYTSNATIPDTLDENSSKEYENPNNATIPENAENTTNGTNEIPENENNSQSFQTSENSNGGKIFEVSKNAEDNEIVDITENLVDNDIAEDSEKWAMETQRLLLITCNANRLSNPRFKISDFPDKDHFQEYFEQYGDCSVSYINMRSTKSSACVTMAEQDDFNRAMENRSKIINGVQCIVLPCPGCGKTKNCY